MTDEKPRILAIDDTPVNLLTLGMALELDFNLQIATSGAMGLSLAEQSPPDLILLDIMMPEMDGFETCKRIKAIPTLANVPVVFISAVAEIESESHGLALGAVDYITKPFNVEIARQRIRNLIEREVLRKDVLYQRDQLAIRMNALDRSNQELRRTQADLIESEAHLRAIILNEPECIKTMDAQGLLLGMNPAGLAMIEADSLQQVVGKPLLNVIASEHRQAFADLHSRVIAGESGKLEFEVVGIKGVRRWLEMHAVPLIEHGKTVLLAVTRDVTERKNSQRRLDQVLLEQRAMLENDLVGIVKTANRIILWANPAFEKMLGYNSGELVGAPMRANYVSDLAYEELVAAANPVLAAGEIFRSQVEQVQKNGDRIWVELNGSLLNRNSGELLWTFVDITDRRRSAEALQRQVEFGNALNVIAQIIIDGEETRSILEMTTTTVGETLRLDRALIYEVTLDDGLVTGLCEWLNPGHPELRSSIGTYPLGLFSATAAEMLRTQKYLTSLLGNVNPFLLKDGAEQLLHQELMIQSLLWFPFAFREGSFNILVLNQVYSCREWTLQEWHLLWLPVMTMLLDFPASMGTRDL